MHLPRKVALAATTVLIIGLFTGCDMPFVREDYNSGYDVYDSDEFELDAATIDEVYLCTDDAYVKLVASDDAALSYEIGGSGRKTDGKSVDFSVEDGRLTVNYDSEGIRNRRCIITVELPMDALNAITADFTTGLVEIGGFNIKTLTCYYTTGMVFVSDVSADSMVGCFTAGAIELSGVEVQSLSLGYSSGHAEASGVYADTAEFMLASGSVNFSGGIAELTADMTSGAAMFELDSAPEVINAAVIGGAMEIELGEEPQNGFTLDYERSSGIIECELAHEGGIGNDTKAGTLSGGAAEHAAVYNVKLDSGVVIIKGK